MKRTIAKFAKAVGTPVSVVAMLTLLPAGAHADVIFEHNGHTYKLVETPMTWGEASDSAKAMALGSERGYLAQIESASENDAIVRALMSRLTEKKLDETIAEDGSNAPFIWLGASDDIEGQWRWSNGGEQFWAGDFNGSPVSGRYSNWGVQPDDAGGSEDALAIGLADWPDPFYDLGETGQWNDLNKDTPLFALIEFDALSDLKVTIGGPSGGDALSGLGAIKGWALSSDGVQSIDVSIDDNFLFNVPYGDARPDVGKAFPDIEGADTSGYSASFNFSRLEAGMHRLTVKATDSFGSVREKSTTFEVARFDSSFIGKNDAVELGWSRDVSTLGSAIIVRGALIDGAFYDIKLEWRTSTQNFEIVEVKKSL